MTDVRLELSGSGIVIDLNSIMDTDEGVQAIDGLTGLGLPPVSVQWVEGAGDGQVYRSKRTLARDIDLPLHIAVPDREELKRQVSLLSRVLSGRCTLTFHDSNNLDVWSVDCYRVGGGDYIYGEDTIGTRELNLTVTLRTENPYWTRSEAVYAALAADEIGAEPLALVNTGTAPAQPVWTLTGPGVSFTATDDEGNTLRYDSFISKGEVITIDTETGTVTDQDGNNRYDSLAEAPRFFALKPGRNSIEIEWDRTSDIFIEEYGQPTYNYIGNPTFNTSTTGWSLNNNVIGTDGQAIEYDSANKRIRFPSHKQFNSKLATTKPLPTITYEVTGLTVGESYTIRARVGYGVKGTKNFSHGTRMVVSCGDSAYGGTLDDMPDEVVVTIPSAQATTATVLLRAPGYLHKGEWFQYEFFVEDVYFGETPNYFDGDTPDTEEFIYSWSGAAHNSKSVRTPVTLVPGEQVHDISDSKVEVAFQPRDWMVV